MTQKERNKLYIARCLIDGKITISDAAEVLSLSERQVKRIKKGVNEHGEAFVIHKNRGRKPSHAITDETKDSVVSLKSSCKYSQANFAHFKKLLEDHESINLSNHPFIEYLHPTELQAPKSIKRLSITNAENGKPKKVCLCKLMPAPMLGFLTNRNIRCMEPLMMPRERY